MMLDFLTANLCLCVSFRFLYCHPALGGLPIEFMAHKSIFGWINMLQFYGFAESCLGESPKASGKKTWKVNNLHNKLEKHPMTNKRISFFTANGRLVVAKQFSDVGIFAFCLTWQVTRAPQVESLDFFRRPQSYIKVCRWQRSITCAKYTFHLVFTTCLTKQCWSTFFRSIGIITYWNPCKIMDFLDFKNVSENDIFRGPFKMLTDIETSYPSAFVTMHEKSQWVMVSSGYKAIKKGRKVDHFWKIWKTFFSSSSRLDKVLDNDVTR